MYQFSKAALVFTLIFSLSGCATFWTKGSYEIPITSNPSGADVTIKDHKGTVVFRGATPAKPKLKGGAGIFKGAKYNIEFSKKGYKNAFQNIGSSVKGAFYASFIFILIGGPIYDVISTKMYKLDTKSVNVNLTEQ